MAYAKRSTKRGLALVCDECEFSFTCVKTLKKHRKNPPKRCPLSGNAPDERKWESDEDPVEEADAESGEASLMMEVDGDVVAVDDSVVHPEPAGVELAGHLVEIMGPAEIAQATDLGAPDLIFEAQFNTDLLRFQQHDGGVGEGGCAKANTGSAWWPFKTREDAMLGMWDWVKPTLPARKMDLLIKLLSTGWIPGNLSSTLTRTRRAHLEARLPMLKPETCKSTQTVMRKVPHPNKPEERVVKTTHVPVTFLYNSIIDMIVRSLCDPLVRKHWLWGPTTDDLDAPVVEFVDSPLAREPRRWARHLFQFSNRGVVFAIGDFVHARDQPLYVYLIDVLSYEAGDWKLNTEVTAWPKLQVQAWEYIIVAGSREVKETGKLYNFPAVDVMAHCTVASASVVRVEGFDFHCVVELSPKPSLQLDDAETSVAWLAIFADGFKDERGRSPVGVYAHGLNIRSGMRSLDAFKMKICVIPPGVDLFEALAPLRRDLALFERGFVWWDPISHKTRNLVGRVAVMPADLMQLYTNVRHGGNACTWNCPNCLIHVQDRGDTHLDIRGVVLERTGELVDMCVKQAEEEVDAWRQLDTHKRFPQGEISASRFDKIRTKYALSKLTPPPFGRNALDECRLGLRDPDHLWLYGIFLCMHNHMFYECMNVPARGRFIARCRDFPCLAGHARLNVPWKIENRKKWGRGISMSLYRQLTFVGVTAYKGLVPPDIYALYVRLWRFYVEIRKPIAAADVSRLQRQGIQLLRDGCAIGHLL